MWSTFWYCWYTNISRYVPYLQTHIPVFRPIGVFPDILINGTVETYNNAVFPIQCFISMNSLGVILHNKALAVGHTNVQMVTVLVVMQEVAFGGFYHNRTGMILSSDIFKKIMMNEWALEKFSISLPGKWSWHGKWRILEDTVSKRSFALWTNLREREWEKFMLTVFHANDVLILRHSARHNNGLNEGKDCYVASPLLEYFLTGWQHYWRPSRQVEIVGRSSSSMVVAVIWCL